MKTSATRGMKRKSIDLVLGDRLEKDSPSTFCISKVVWDNDDDIDEDTETNDIQDSQTEDV
jgi:hypothetical protein